MLKQTLHQIGESNKLQARIKQKSPLWNYTIGLSNKVTEWSKTSWSWIFSTKQPKRPTKTNPVLIKNLTFPISSGSLKPRTPHKTSTTFSSLILKKLYMMSVLISFKMLNPLQPFMTVRCHIFSKSLKISSSCKNWRTKHTF